MSSLYARKLFVYSTRRTGGLSFHARMQGNLDETFGVVVTPDEDAVEEWERSTTPHSRVELSVQTASGLKAFFEAPTLGFAGAELLAAECKVIWIVTEAGEILLALEEVIQADGKEMLTPRMRATDYSDIHRLGHPALVKGGGGRIGGEISFDPETKKWTINNLSGRYGRSEFGRTKIHLSSANNVFAACGIELNERFI